LTLRCTEFDVDGNVTVVNGEFKKSELIQKVRFRDLDTGGPACSQVFRSSNDHQWLATKYFKDTRN